MRAAPLLVLLALPLAGCAEGPEAPDVVVTFYPLEFVATRLANGTLEVGTLVPPGVEPHDWEPSPSDLARADGSSLLLAQGVGFEPWLDGLRAALGRDAPPIVQTTSNVALLEAEEGADPHTWLDPVRFRQQADTASLAMQATFPEDAARYRVNGEALAEELLALHHDFEEGLATCEVRTIVANHDAYSYLADRYAFDVVAISGLSPDAEPSPEDLARAAEAARAHNLTVIFFEELVSPRVAQVVADEVGARTLVLSPAESRPAQGDYLTLMRQNLVHLREAMRCA